jgi:demethylmenaquinone methyltransferase/2-methoxy-6-polyprenyl-1,4-benzoquinol methylase
MSIKKENTPAMFDEIANTYDSLNHILSFGLDKKWRKKFIKNLPAKKYETIVDIASGTGDLLVNLQTLNATNYFALDPAENMLNIAKIKVPNANFIICNAEKIPLPDNSCNLVTISFGIRNFSNLDAAFAEIHRILRTDGIVSIMEFSQPRFFLFRFGFIIYLKLILPIVGRIVSNNKSAYKYLQSSIFDFAKNVDVFKLLEANKLTKINEKRMLFGVVRIYVSGK